MKILTQLLKSSILLPILSVGVLSSCVKERIIEKTIQPEKIADKKIENSISASQQSETITIKKDQLGKAFLLSPILFSTGQTPMPSFMKPLIVGFERFGNKAAMYNYTDEQLYDILPASKLLQTFRIINETDTEIILSFKEGFKSLNLISSLNIVMKETLDDLKETMSSGQESSLEIKDSFLKNISIENNTIYISQVIRTINHKLESKPDSNSSTSEKTQKFTINEVTNDYTFELKPYVENKNFKSKTYDKNQRVGFFINFKSEAQKDEPIPQISKWDISENKSAIEIRFHEKTPLEMLPIMEEGIAYWNKVFGREVFKKGNSFKTGEKQPDRSIFVYWVPWDSAGFAVAGLQTDPLTGETLKGSVFMTSSWYKSTLDEVNVSFSTKNPDFDQFKNGNCFLEQSLFLNTETDPNSSITKKITADTIRIVFSHEMGHVIGLRHNFAGSFSNEKTDQEVLSAEKAYKINQDMQIPISTTVMDYTVGLQTAMQGSVIKNAILPYDKAAIDWGYFDKEPNIPKYSYCSDEHIMMASKQKKSIYGCDRFDRYKNVLRGKFKNSLDDEIHKITSIVSSLIYSKKSSDSYYANNFKFDNFLYIATHKFESMTNNIEDYLYIENQNEKTLSINSVIDNTLNVLEYKGWSFSDYLINDMVKKDATEIGGYSGLLKSLLDLQDQAQGKLYENQVVHFFNSDQVNTIKKFLDETQIKLLSEKLLESAKKSDLAYKANLIKNFPLKKQMSETDPTTKISKAVTKNMSNSIPMGDFDFLINLYSLVYEKAIQQTIKKITINGQELEVPFVTNYAAEELNNAKLLFKLMVLEFDTRTKLSEAKNKLKTLSVFKTLEIFKQLNITLTSQSSENLRSNLSNIDWMSSSTFLDRVNPT